MRGRHMDTTEGIEVRLETRHCKPCEQGGAPLADAELDRYLAGVTGWESDRKVIGKRFEFKNYYHTMAFVNAVAWIAHHEGHHPDLVVSYNACRVSYTTHALGGLSENDFICAAKVDALLI
jgi:4a-hydroxytetrahydrobiopterin dehydratase